MKSFIGVGKGQSAVENATNGLSNPSGILFYAPYDLIEEAAAQIYEKYPDTPSIGVIGTNFTNGAAQTDVLTVVGFLNDTKVACGVIPEVSKYPVAKEAEILQKMAEVSAESGNTVCIEYCSGAEEKLVTTMAACLQKKGIQLAGGTAFGAPDGKPSLVAYNGRVYEDACAYAFVKNLSGRVRVYKENIYENQATTAHYATKVDVSRKAVIELDGRPAADVYSEEVGIPKSKIVDNVLQNPMGRAVGDEVFISSMNGLDADGTLTNYKRINKNDCIYFLTLGDYDAIERATREKIKADAKRISLIISIDCIYRYLLYDGNGYINTYVKNMASLSPHVGTVGGGEQFNNQHVNQTMVCAVFE